MKNAKPLELQNIIRFGADKIIENNDSEFVTDEDIETILKYSTEKSNELDKMINSMGEEKLRNFTVDAPPPANLLDLNTTRDTYQFEGQDYRYANQISAISLFYRSVIAISFIVFNSGFCVNDIGGITLIWQAWIYQLKGIEKVVLVLKVRILKNIRLG